MLDALWELTSDVIRVRWSVDVPRLTPSPVEEFQATGSHRAPPPPTGRAKVFEGLASLVPNWVARFEGECRSLPMRADGDVGGAR